MNGTLLRLTSLFFSRSIWYQPTTQAAPPNLKLMLTLKSYFTRKKYSKMDLGHFILKQVHDDQDACLWKRLGATYRVISITCYASYLSIIAPIKCKTSHTKHILPDQLHLRLKEKLFKSDFLQIVLTLFLL